MKLVAMAAARLNVSASDVIRWFGRKALPLLTKKFPELFAGHKSTRPFLLTLNRIIHPEVKKIYPGADVPEFEYDTSSTTVLTMKYRSARKLCALGEGLIEGAAAYYGERVAIEQLECMNRGDASCIFRLTFLEKTS
jgi:hypothetical protein